MRGRRQPARRCESHHARGLQSVYWCDCRGRQCLFPPPLQTALIILMEKRLPHNVLSIIVSLERRLRESPLLSRGHRPDGCGVRAARTFISNLLEHLLRRGVQPAVPHHHQHLAGRVGGGRRQPGETRDRRIHPGRNKTLITCETRKRILEIAFWRSPGEQPSPRARVRIDLRGRTLSPSGKPGRLARRSSWQLEPVRIMVAIVAGPPFALFHFVRLKRCGETREVSRATRRLGRPEGGKDTTGRERRDQPKSQHQRSRSGRGVPRRWALVLRKGDEGRVRLCVDLECRRGALPRAAVLTQKGARPVFDFSSSRRQA